MINILPLGLSAQYDLQPWNASSFVNQQLAQQNPSFATGLNFHIQNISNLAQLQSAPSNNAPESAPLLTLPVVVHIIHDPSDSLGAMTNISINQIESQITQLNVAYQNTNPNLTNSPTTFQSMAENADIAFCLARIDPNGNPTNGITRTAHPSAAINNLAYIEGVIKPASQWDPADYINIWVVKIPGTNIFGGIQGYSYTPVNGFAGVAAQDGVVIDYRFFGKGGNATGDGIAAVREIGRYLGLLDIWGMNNANGTPIGCSSDDGLTDTPPQAAPTGMTHPSCPSTIPTSCTSQDLYANYMDFLNDQTCQTLFTDDQVNVMRSVLLGLGASLGYGSRYSLVTHGITTCSNPCAINLSTSTTPKSCGNLPDGTATITISGGTSPYTSTSSSGTIISTPTGLTITGLSQGTHQLLVTDATGCQQSTSILITSASNISASISTTPETCNNFDGTATITPLGGALPYNITWTTPSGSTLTGSSINGLTPGIYTVSITDAMGCTYSDTTTIHRYCSESCDTFTIADLSNVSANLYYNPIAGGFISGTNGYNHQAFANYCNYPGANTHVTGLFLGVAIASPNSPTATIEFVIWENTGGQPGIELGSKFVLIQSLTNNAQLLQPNYITFDTPIPVSTPFFVGVKIPPTANGDTIAFYTSTINDGASGTNVAWEQWSDGSWHDFSSSWDVDMGIAILPLLGTPPVANFSPTNVTVCDTQAVVQFNNLSSGENSVIWELQGATSPTITANYATTSYLNTGVFDAALIALNDCISDTLLVENAVTVNDCPTGCTLYATLTSTNVNCNSGNNGTAIALPFDGTAPYSFLWSNNTTINSVTNLTAGIHTVTVTDANNCSVIGTVKIEEPTDSISTTMTVMDESCAFNDGSAYITAAGGTGNFTYLWNTAANSDTIQNLNEGTYIITVTDAIGCTKIDTAIIEAAPEIILNFSTINNVSCFGSSDGNATINATGGAMPYTYNWSNGSDSASIANVGPGTYYLTVTDNGGCIALDTVILTEPTMMNIAIQNVTNVNCGGDTTGAATINVTGGSHAYTYLWSNGSDSASIANVGTGNYTVTVTDTSQCAISLSININEPPLFTLLPSAMNSLNCANDSTGFAMVNVTGGIAPYSYFWSDSTITSTISNVGAGTYYASITDGNNCLLIDTINIIAPPPLVLTPQNVVNIGCAGTLSGSATVNVTGGVMPYTYLWSNNETSNSITNVSAGVYIVTVTDMNNCSDTLSIHITQTNPISINTIDTMFIDCAGNMTGGFRITPSGGVAPYSYAWAGNPSNNTDSITNIGAGTYTVTITDVSNCTFSQNLTLSEPTPLNSTITVQNLPCATGQNGIASVSVSGGISPYQYTWNHITQNINNVTNLSLGQYFVTVTDTNNCTLLDTATITSPPPIVISVTTTPVSCVGGFNGTAIATVSGGFGNYNYIWDNTPGNPTINNLIAGQHTLTIIDQNNCQMIDTFIVSTIPALTVAGVTAQPVSCFGQVDGSATIQVSGGTLPYTYTWNTNPSQSTPTATNLPAGIYQVVVTDLNGCSLPPVSVTVDEPSELTIDNIFLQEPNCNNSSDGSIMIFASGGTPTGAGNYFYQWSGSSSVSNVANNLLAGNYGVTVTDINGCSVSGNGTLTAPPTMTADIISTEVSCFGEDDGTIKVNTIIGGTPPYTYAVTGAIFIPITIQTTDLPSGVYNTVVKDANGCTFTQPQTITEPPAITVDLGDDAEIVLGGTLQLDATINSLVPVAYTWTTIDTSISCLDCPDPIIRPIANNNNYLVSVVDSNGCSASDDINVKVIRDRRIFVPNIFTPNDDGNNDLLIVYGGTGVEEILTFKIFNRWGELVHFAENFPPNSEAHGWNGLQRGKKLSPDVFVYMIEVRFSDGLTNVYTGDITLFIN